MLYSSSQAAKKKVLKKKAEQRFRRTTSFTSSEDESPKAEGVAKRESKENKPAGAEEAEEDDSHTYERPTTWKCDVKMEKLHKNIVDHKHNQYKTWLDKEIEIKLRKEQGEEPRKPKLIKSAKSTKAAKNIKSKPMLSSGSNGDSDSDDILTKFKNRMNKYKKPGVEAAFEENTKSNGKPTTKENKSSNVVEKNISPEISPEKKSDDEMAKPTFSDSESEEENQNELVDMLFDMINDEDPKANNKEDVTKTEVVNNVDPIENNKEETTGNENEDLKYKIQDEDHAMVELTLTEEIQENFSPSVFDDPDLQSFFTALKMTIGYDTIENQFCDGISLSKLENLVGDAILQLDFTPPDFKNEDKKYREEHGLKIGQVNVCNIRKDDAWLDYDEEYLDQFRVTLGNKLSWKEILQEGLIKAKEFYKTASDPSTASSPQKPKFDSDDDSNAIMNETEAISPVPEATLKDAFDALGTRKTNDEQASAENGVIPASPDNKRAGSVSSDDTITISRRSRKSSVSSEDFQLSSKSKKSEPMRRSISSDEEVKVSKKVKERSASSSSDISVKDLIKSRTKRAVSESSDDSIVITRKDNKGKSSDRKSSTRDNMSQKSEKSSKSHHKYDSHHKKKKHKRDRERQNDEQKAIDIPGFKIPKADKKDKEKSKDKYKLDSKKDNEEIQPLSSTRPPKIDKKQDLEKIVEKSHASDPGLSSILSSMDKLSKSNKKKHKEKKKKKDRDKHRDRDKDSPGVRIGDSDEEELPLPVPAGDEEDLPLPVPAGTDPDDLDADLPAPVPAGDDTTVTAADTGADCDDHYVEDFPDHNNDPIDDNPTENISASTVNCVTSNDAFFDTPRPGSACSVHSDEDTSYISNFPKPVKGVHRRVLLAPPLRGPPPPHRPSLRGQKPNSFEHGRDHDQTPRSLKSTRTPRLGFDDSQRCEVSSPIDFHNHGTDYFPDNFEERNNTSSSKPKPKPILKEKRETENSHFSRAKVSFNVSDSDIERTDSDRSRTPSPFLSTNKYYPWLYDKENAEDEGIQLESIKINDRDKDEDYAGSKKQSARLPREADSEEVETEERERKKGLGKFLDKVISSLKTQNPSAPSQPPCQPPLPPGPPRPVPSPYDPVQIRPGLPNLAPPPPPPPPQDVSPSKIPLPPPTPRHESPEPGEITEEAERKLEAAQRKLGQLRQTWGRSAGAPHEAHTRQDRDGGHQRHGHEEYTLMGRDGGKRKYENPRQFKRKFQDEPYLDNSRYDVHAGGYGVDYTDCYAEEQSNPSLNAESAWIDKFLIAWQELIANHEYYVRRDLKDEGSASNLKEDLGSVFNEPRLNTRVRARDTGEERSLYTCDLSRGSSQLTCTVCGVTVMGIKVLQTHWGGRKHLAKLEEYHVIGKQ